MVTAWASRRLPVRRAVLGIVYVTALSALRLRRVVVNDIDRGTIRTESAGLWELSRVGMMRKHIRREQVNGLRASGARNLLDPEVVEGFGFFAVRKRGSVKASNHTRNVFLDSSEGAQNRAAVVNGERVTHEEMRDWIDVPADGASTEL